nr:LysR family transcriptional regulator [Devosia sp. FKR38]
MRPSADSLRIFEMCVRTGSFAAAAERLALSPAAVSLRIRTLEAELGQPLFLRLGRKAVPTPEAVTLAHSVRTALDDIAAALDSFQAGSAPLRVSLPPTFAARWLAPRLPDYRAKGGHAIALDISSDLREPDQFDLAIRTGRGGWDGLEEWPLLPVDATPMLAPALLGSRRLAAPGDLAAFDLLPHPDWVHWFAHCGTGMPPDLRFAAVDYSLFELIAQAAVRGQGVGLLSPTLFAAELADGVLVAPFASVVRGPDWYLAVMRKGDQRPGPQAFRRWLCGQAGVASTD